MLGKVSTLGQWPSVWSLKKDGYIIFGLQQFRMNQTPQVQDSKASHKFNEGIQMVMRTKLSPRSILLRICRKPDEAFQFP